MAPITCTHREAAAAAIFRIFCHTDGRYGNKHKQRRSCIPANLKHSVLDFPSTRATAKAAVKVSPAPVVSRTLGADIMGCFIGSSPSMNRAEPLAPSFTRTLLTP